MAEEHQGAAGFTVGSLLGTPLGTDPLGARRSAADGPDLTRVPATENEGAGWMIRGGDALVGAGHAGFRADGVEALDYNNPFNLGVERVWFDGKIVYALDAGEVDIATAGEVKVAKEYQPVYSVELDDKGKLKKKDEVAPPPLTKDQELLAEIRDLLREKRA